MISFTNEHDLDMQDEIEVNIRTAVYPSGDPVHLRERERAAQFLLANAKKAYPRILELVRNKPLTWETPQLIEILGRFGRNDSVHLLEQLLIKAIPDTSRAAGRALAAINTPAARQALKSALDTDTIEIMISVVEGMRLCGGRDWCSSLEPVLSHPDASLRYYAVNASAQLGCLDANKLSVIATQDQDHAIRQLATQWMTKYRM